MSIAAAEMMEGIYVFLQQCNIRVPTPPPAVEPDLFDSSSWMRGFAEIFYTEKLESIKRALPHILSYAYYILPENGPQFAQEISNLAMTILILKAKGVEDQKIVESLLAR